MADDLAQYRQWAPRLHDLGECEVKHGVRLHLVNLYTEQLGNPALPLKLQQEREKEETAAAARSPSRNKPLLIVLSVLIFLLIGLALVVFIFAPAAVKSLSRQRSYAHIGKADQAITLISQLLTTPAAYGVTVAHLRLSWEWDPLRQDPRFKALIEGPEPATIYK